MTAKDVLDNKSLKHLHASAKTVFDSGFTDFQFIRFNPANWSTEWQDKVGRIYTVISGYPVYRPLAAWRAQRRCPHAMIEGRKCQMCGMVRESDE
jgi:hypothetical protein